MQKILKNSWALFLGMGLIMLAHGYQGSLLGVRAVKEDFSLTATGFMLSGYYVGYFIGAKTITNLISRVGHIRVFAAFASIASIVVLMHSILINPFTWFILRVITGISMVSIYLHPVYNRLKYQAFDSSVYSVLQYLQSYNLVRFNFQSSG